MAWGLLQSNTFRHLITLIGCALIGCSQTISFAQTAPSGDQLFALGDSCYYKGDYSGSIIYYRQALALYREEQDTAKVAKSLNDMGVSFRRIGEFDSALNYYHQAVNLDVLRKDTLRIVNRYFNLSNVHNDRGNYSKASELMIKALVLAESKNYTKSKANLNNALGLLYYNQKDFDRALPYYHKAKSVYEELEDDYRINIVLNNIGSCHADLEQWDSAFFYLRHALQLNRQDEESKMLDVTLHNMGSLHFAMQTFDSAEFYFMQAYEMRQNLSDGYGMAYTGNDLGKLFLSMGRPEKAILYLLEAQEYAETEKNYTILIDNIDAMNDYYLMVGDTARAYQALNQWAVLKDSLYNQERVKAMELQSAFDLNRKEEERRLQEENARNQSQLAEKRLIIIAVITGAALLLVLLVLFVIRQRSKIKRLNENLKLVNRDMYHRKKNDYMRLLNEISATNVTISEDIRGQLLASAAVDDSLYEESYDMVELSDYLEDRLDDIADAQGLSSKEVVLKSSLNKIKVNGQVATAILPVLNELMTNSVKHSFADRGGIIHVTISGESGRLQVIYKDDGAPFVPKVKSAGMGQKIIEQVLKTLRSELSREVQGQWNLSSFEIKV